jgi:chromosome segregation ATPase
MSGAQGGRGGTFARRGSSSKKVRHSKQDFHEHKVRLVEGGSPLDFPALRERTIQSLDRLGRQAFVPDSGYGLEGWMKSLDLLLGEFEAAAAGESALTESYSKKKEEILSSLRKSAESPQLDSEIAGARELQRKVASALGNKDASYFGSKLSDLNRRHESLSAQLESQRALIARIKAQPRPGRLFHRFLGEKPPSTAEEEATAAKLEKDRGDVESEISMVQAEQLLYEEGKRQLSQATDTLNRLEGAKVERLQLKQEREDAARALSEEISKMVPSHG